MTPIVIFLSKTFLLEFLKQITMNLDDIGTHSVKIGMLHNPDIIKSVYKTLKR